MQADLDLGVVNDALLAGESQGLEHLLHLGLAVGGVDAYGVAGRVGHTLFELQLDVDGLFF